MSARILETSVLLVAASSTRNSTRSSRSLSLLPRRIASAARAAPTASFSSALERQQQQQRLLVDRTQCSCIERLEIPAPDAAAAVEVAGARIGTGCLPMRSRHGGRHRGPGARGHKLGVGVGVVAIGKEAPGPPPRGSKPHLLHAPAAGH
mmetsp:Transcript_24612/g.52078  ORF Transcript_24612/g.52078 Transcript_24612/m.52078 type:complete len:150 (-) Transcript_24612:945-1394(-)